MSIPADQSFDLAIGQAATLRVTMDPPESVAGWTTRFRVRPRNGGSPVIDKATGSGVTITNSSTGIFDIAITATDTAGGTLAPGTYRWSFWRIDAGSEFPIAVGLCEAKVTAQTG